MGREGGNMGGEKGYRVLLEGGQAEIVVKKSKFIATVRRVVSEEEAVSFIGEMKKRYWDASHNCSAFVVGRSSPLTRCSDDGEPPGTAGRPILEVLLGEELHDAAVVVTRYFGGTLLGAGGLVRAYTQAVKEGLQVCAAGTERPGCRISVRTDYTGLGRIQNLLGNEGIEPEAAVYTDRVELTLLLPAEREERLRMAAVEACCGRVEWEKLEELYYTEKG